MKSVALKDLDASVRDLVSGLGDGESLGITDGGRIIARLERNGTELLQTDVDPAERQRRHLAFIDRLRSLPARHLGKFIRDDLYEDDHP